jgi:ADP-dependent NAD(P)H-hydrate dehydratase / NAD(P)H-hydrate epimerase
MSATGLHSAAHPILTGAAAGAWEEKLLLGHEQLEWAAMSRAGRALAAAVLEDARECGGLPDDARLLVLCGKGHNGGDALIALRTLLEARSRAAALVLVVPGFSALRPLVRRALEDVWRAQGARVEWRCVSGCADGADAALVNARLAGAAFDLCLDGLFGLQFRPPLRAPADWLVAAINRHPAIRLRAAVDVPSGVGDASASEPFRADFSYATGIAKAPLFAAANRASVGRVRYLDLGFFDEAAPTLKSAARAAVLTVDVLAPLCTLRRADADKRAFGHLFIVSGSRSLPGAVFMAVQAALHSGAGLVTAFVPESVAPAFAAQLPEAMWVPMPETPTGGLALEGRGMIVARAARCTALLAGPGLGRDDETLALIAELLRAIEVPAVLDADALQPSVVAARGARPAAPLVLTPHAGEFERIAGGAAPDDDGLRTAATQLGATIILKGAPTRVSEGDVVYVSPFGGPVLARGGSGDVLAGLVAGQLATGATALEAAARGVVWHGCAADRLARETGQSSTRVTELVGHLPGVLREAAHG